MKNLQVDDEFYKKLSKYAVFIPIINIDGKDHILFEVRSDIVSQKGEVSFPGGGVNKGESFEMAAIRECREELNLDEKDISLKGYSSMILSSSERIIKAYFGRINKKFEHISYNVEVVYGFWAFLFFFVFWMSTTSNLSLSILFKIFSAPFSLEIFIFLDFVP